MNSTGTLRQKLHFCAVKWLETLTKTEEERGILEYTSDTFLLLSKLNSKSCLLLSSVQTFLHAVSQNIKTKKKKKKKKKKLQTTSWLHTRSIRESDWNGWKWLYEDEAVAGSRGFYSRFIVCKTENQLQQQQQQQYMYWWYRPTSL